jgi:DeoR/GlpR family transcriptional regulator of sugar metabolism
MLSSCAAVLDGAAYERSLDQKELKRMAFKNSKMRVLIIDHTKFGGHGTYRLAGLDEYDFVVTDKIPETATGLEHVKFL